MNYLLTYFGGQNKKDVEEVKEVSDETFYQTIENTKQLQASTKKIYFNRLNIIQNEMFESFRSLFWIMTHPSEFEEALLDYSTKTNLADRSVAQYVAIVISLLIHNSEMIENYNSEFKEFCIHS